MWLIQGKTLFILVLFVCSIICANGQSPPSSQLYVRNNNQPSTNSKEADVIILGAGIAGIATAHSLIKHHGIKDVLLLEARPVVGGRAYLEELKDPRNGKTLHVEKGCNWIQGYGHENITKLAKKWNLQTQSQNYSSISYFNGTRGLASDDSNIAPGKFLNDDQLNFMDAYDEAADNITGYVDQRLKRQEVDLTARAALSILDWLPITPLQKVYEWFNVDFTFAQPPEVCSLFNTFSVSEEADEDRLVIDQRGYRHIFVKELEEVFGPSLNDSRLHVNTTVKNINYTNKQTKIETNQGTYTARKHVIVTFSIGVLQDNQVTWTPRLPNWKKEAIYSFAMAVYQKTFLLFERQFWRDDQFQVYADPDQRGRYPLWQNLNAPGFFNGSSQGYVYFVTHVDQEARRIGSLDDEDVKAEAMFKLKEMYGDDIPEPLDILIPRWDQDPLFRGSYSNWPLGELDQHHDNLRQPVGENKVFFTGEAYSKEMFGYVQGAWEEGKQTGAKIASCLKGNGCPNGFAFESIKTCSQQQTSLKRRNVLQRRSQRNKKI